MSWAPEITSAKTPGPEESAPLRNRKESWNGVNEGSLQRGRACLAAGLGDDLDLAQQNDVVYIWLPSGEWIIDQQKWKERDQMGGCCSSLGESGGSLRLGWGLAVEMERNGWL